MVNRGPVAWLQVAHQQDAAWLTLQLHVTKHPHPLPQYVAYTIQYILKALAIQYTSSNDSHFLKDNLSSSPQTILSEYSMKAGYITQYYSITQVIKYKGKHVMHTHSHKCV